MPLLLLPTLLVSAHSAEVAQTTTRTAPSFRRPVFDLRVGVDRLDQRHPVLCGEIAPLAWLSVEACGTGAGILHQDANAIDMAHFRARGRVLGVGGGRATADLLLGAGFAEIQRSADQPGFRFGPAQQAAPIEAAGPEASVSVKGRYRLDPAGWTYATADLGAGVAAIPAAPAVLGRGGIAVPFASFTLGLGF